MFQKLQYFLVTLLSVITCSTSLYATDISNGLIYNTQRFLGTSEDVYVTDMVQACVSLYLYENGAYTRLRPDYDFNYTVTDAAGNECLYMEDYGKYLLTITGKDDYTGTVSQTLYKVPGGNWDNHTAESFSNIDEANHVITIMNEAEFALFSDKFKGTEQPYSGWTFRLNCDLDMSAHSWNPIGCGRTPGDDVAVVCHFDGQGHTISGIHVTGSGNAQGGQYFRGLFGYVYHNSSIQNFTLTESTISSSVNNCVGAVVGAIGSYSYIQNCHVTNSVQVVCTYGNNIHKSEAYGGIAGDCGCSIRGCTSAADVFMVPGTEIDGGRFGGIIGNYDTYTPYDIKDNVYYGKHLYCTVNAGTIAGYVDKIQDASAVFTNNTYVPGVNASLPAIGNSTASDSYPSTLYDVNDFEPSELGTMVREYTYNDLSLTVYSYAMVHGDKCFMRDETGITGLSGDGTVSNPYLIGSTDNFNTLASYVSSGYRFRGKYFRQTADISVSTMIGTSESPFMGTFDGDGHTLNVTYGSESAPIAEDFVAPFRYTNSTSTATPTFMNLTVSGTIYSSGKHASGLVGKTYNNALIDNCTSNVSIHTTGQLAGGLVGFSDGNQSQSTVTIQNCVSNANITTSAKFAGGVVGGIQAVATTNITNCLSNATINSSINGDGSHGGFIGMPNRGSNTDTYTINIEGCAFTGNFVGSNTSNWGGFVGYKASGYTVNVANSIFAPSSLSSINTSGCSNFVRSNTGTINIANSYYVLGFNSNQGKQSYMLTLGVQPISGGTASVSGNNTVYNVSNITAYNVGMKFYDHYYVGNGEVVNLEATPNAVFSFSHWDGGSTDNPYEYTMSATNIVINAFFDIPIASADDWNTFCASVNGGNDYNGLTVSLANDIGPVSAMAGTDSRPFSGTFDGKGHTLTFTRTSTDDDEFTAPFRYIEGATIQNLKVDGTITANHQFCAGLAGDCIGPDVNYFINCVSDVTINSTVDGDGTHGGFISRVQIASAYFRGCAFTGKLLGSDTHSWGGFVGWTDDENEGYSLFVDCVFAPSEININNEGCKTFSRGYLDSGNQVEGIHITNCFYDAEKNLGTDQGFALQYTIAGDTDVTVALAGETTDYDLSGITGYGDASNAPIVIKYGNTIYAKSGFTVSLNLTYNGSGDIVFTADHGTLSGEGNPYSLVMDTYNTIISAMVICDAPTTVAVAVATLNTANVSWEGDAALYNLRYRKLNPNNNTATVILRAGDVWGDYDDTGYQMLLDADATAYGTTIPESGALSQNCSGNETIYAEFEYKIPENADGNCSTQNIVFNNSVSITIPAGTYDWCITNPSPNSGIWIASENGNIGGRQDNYVFESGKIYEFYVYLDEGGESDAVDLTITDDLNNHTATEWTVIEGITTDSYTIEGLETESLYEVQVQSDCDIPSEWTSTVYFNTPSVCDAPTNLNAEVTNSSAALSWSDYQDNYKVRYRTAEVDAYSFYENFEDESSVTDHWNAVDYDDDGSCWEFVEEAGYNNSKCIMSRSYNVQPLDPDDWLITPKITLQGTMEVWMANHIAAHHESFAIYLTTDNLSSFSTEEEVVQSFLNGTTLVAKTTLEGEAFQLFTADLSSYNGAEGYIAIRHFDSENKYILMMDNFGIKVRDHVPAGDWVELTASEAAATLNGLNPNTTYEWQVQGLDCDGEGSSTDWSEIASFTTPDFSIFTKDITKYTGDKDHYYLIASPIGTVDPELVGNMLTNDYDLYRFDQSQDLEWLNYKGETFNLEPGKGYLYANSGDGENDITTLTFSGQPYTDGTVTLSKVDNVHFSGWNLIGNPLSTAATINKPFYRMNEDGSALSAQVETGNQVAAMEGVFVQATQNGETATFTPVTRSNGNETAGMLTIGVTQVVEPVETPANRGNGPSTGSGTLTAATLDRAIVRFDGGQTLGKFTLSPDDNKLYIQQEGEDYAVVNAGKAGELPLNFKATKNGNYTMSVGCEAVSFSYLHLIDNMTGADVDLLKTPSYTFDALTTDYASRFKLVFATGSSNEGDDFAFFSNGSFVINNEGEATLQVIDLLGRILNSETINGCANVNVDAAPGVYMLRLINGNDVKVQKVVVR